MDKGDRGYIDAVKKKNLKFGLMGIAAMFLIYIIGLMVSGDNSSYATLLAVLLALPAAQMLSRYFSLLHYKSIPRQIEETLCEVSNATVLYELILVQNKKNHFIDAAVVSNTTIAVLVSEKSFDSKIIGHMLKLKGISREVVVYKDLTSMKARLSDLEAVDQLAHKVVREKLLDNSL